VSRLLTWDLPQGLGDYDNLPADLVYSAAQIDPAIQISGEADAIWTSRLYIIQSTRFSIRDSLYDIIAGNRRSSVPEFAVVVQGGGAAV
jgi:hypothetical protein